jgi:hypothetical protein
VPDRGYGQDEGPPGESLEGLRVARLEPPGGKAPASRSTVLLHHPLIGRAVNRTTGPARPLETILARPSARKRGRRTERRDLRP